MSKARCVALVHSRTHEDLWTPCVRAAQPGGVLCREHRDALDGALLGLESSDVVPRSQPASYRYILAEPGPVPRGGGGAAKTSASDFARSRPHLTRSSVPSAPRSSRGRTN